MIGEHLVLSGCESTPLASYLKALGVLRLIHSPSNHISGKPADPHARGWWEGECFHLRTTLDRKALLDFFLHEYSPSPIIAAWNGRSGFLEGGQKPGRGGAKLMRAIEESDCLRLKFMRSTVHRLRQMKDLQKYNQLRTCEKILGRESSKLKGEEKKLNDADKRRAANEAKAIKGRLLPILRSETDPQHLSFIDACYVLSTDEFAAPLLGSGGNDGSRDFGVNFATAIQTLISFEDGGPTAYAFSELTSALFSVVGRIHVRDSMGQFSPGHGGPNATTGYEGKNPLNSWDVVLAMEGALTFAGALTRRWGKTGTSRAAFPFTFAPTSAGAGSLSPEDPNRPRGEVWVPLWPKPSKYAEISAIFAEGRLTLGRQTVRTGLDAARSVARVGSARGISGFERYSLIQPDSKNPYQATPLGRFDVPRRPNRDLVGELEAGGWLERIRRLAGNKKTAPFRARQALRQLEDALFQMTNANRVSEGARNALIAIGSMVDWLATNPTTRKASTPPPPISSSWIREADDKTAEFRIATALAGVGLPAPQRLRDDATAKIDDDLPVAREESDINPLSDASKKARSKSVPPMAAYLAPVSEDSFFYRGALSTRRIWSDGDASPTLVWRAGPLVSNMIAVLERRLLDAASRGLGDKPLDSACTANLSDVAAFLSGDFDDARCSALLKGLVWVQPRAKADGALQRSNRVTISFAYATLKPVFTPDVKLHEVGVLPETSRMPVPPGLISRLRAGGASHDGIATNIAVRSAVARARASGLASLFDPARRAGIDSSRVGAGVAANRLAAALLIPISEWALKFLIKRSYPGTLPENDNVKPTTEDVTTHAI